MWHESALFGIYFSPLVIYAFVALMLWLPLRYLWLRLRLDRFIHVPALAQLTIFMCLLAALVTWL